MEKGTNISSSLPEVFESIDTTVHKSFWKKLFAFVGPAYLVSVGYMDPGNWATDIAGGSQFGYTLIWVLLMSNLIALLLQSHCARLGIVRGRDLAQASREHYPPLVNIFLYILAEIAIAACDLAEVLGMAIGLQLLFDIPLLWGVVITVADTLVLLVLQRYGMRKMEVFIVSLVIIIGLSFLIEMILAHPAITDIAGGFIPSIPNDTALYIAIGIIGATVMPHNLYLHSSLVQSRKIDRSSKGLASAIKFNFIDSAIALNLAFFVNAAILILAASAFFRNGMFQVSEIQDAHHFLEPLLGSKFAPMLFAIALIAAGQSSTITGTLAGQIVMEGYLNLRIQPWIRRLLTRIIAIGPALIVIIIYGEAYTGKLLVFSQVLLSLQLGFAIIPLIHFVSDKGKMGEFTIGKLARILSWLSAIIIISLNIRLVWQQVSDWMAISPDSIVIPFIVIPVCILAGIVLLYISFTPFIVKRKEKKAVSLHGPLHDIQLTTTPTYMRVAVCVDFSEKDKLAISHALAQGKENSTYLLIHVVETAGAWLLGNDISDLETSSDQENLEKYAQKLRSLGYTIETGLGYGSPKKAIPELVKKFEAQLLVMGAHGHKMLKDILLGTTVDSVRHRLEIPVLVVKN